MPLFAAAIFLSAFLLFQIQPLIAKVILPWFGGTAAVWATCLAFFQTLLLGGYVYAHSLVRRLSFPRQRQVHAVMLGACLAFLPVRVSEWWKPPGSENPASSIAGMLAAAIGLPYLALAATGPLLQAWLVQAKPGVAPYRLFALSNLGSMLALVTYPICFEPYFTLRQQRLIWSAGFAVFVLLCAAAAWQTRRARDAGPGVVEGRSGEAPANRGWWGVLAMAPSMLLVALTNYITQDVASFPFLWILPLAIYLVSFIVCFDAPRWYRRRLFLGSTGPVLAGTAYLIWSEVLTKPGTFGVIALLCCALFVLCMFSHGELARRRPHPRHLTSYYLTIALGGAAGGTFVAVACPLMFNATYELPLTLGLIGLLLLFVTLPLDPSRGLSWAKIGMLVAYASLLGFLLRVSQDFTVDTRAAVRNFYGELRVKDYEETGEDAETYRVLLHGLINHGEQYVRTELQSKLVHYYCPDTGIGRLMEARDPRRPERVGVLGLGAGALAAFGREGDEYQFYEINPQVEPLARTQFTYLRNSRAMVSVKLGDGRMVLEREPPQNFDLLLMDAFSSDAIPVHLLTVEAMRVYQRHLKPGGVLVVHITNQNVDLKPVVAAAARELGWVIRLFETPGDDSEHCYRTRFALLAEDASRFSHAAFGNAGAVVEPPPGFRVWTDDYSNLLRVLK